MFLVQDKIIDENKQFKTNIVCTLFSSNITYKHFNINNIYKP